MNRFLTYKINYVPSKILNKCIKEDIRLQNISYNEKSITLTINEKDEIRLKKILNDLDCKYDLILKSGFKNFLLNIWERKGIIAAVIVCIVAVALLSKISFFVVDGNLKSFKEDKIIEIFNEYKEYNLYYELNDGEKSEIKNKIIEIQGVSNCEIRKKGLFIVVDIKKTLNDSYFISSNNQPIVSKYDAIVTKVICLDGTAVAKREQTVRKGDVLIKNSVTINEEEFPSNTYGEVYGRVFYHDRKLFNLTSMEKVKTGNTVTYNQIEFFNIKSNNSKPVPYKNYTVEVKKIKIFNLLPITVNRYIISEYKNELVSYSIDEVKGAITAEMAEQIKSQINCDFKVLKTNTIIKKTDNYYVIDVYLEAEHRIDK